MGILSANFLPSIQYKASVAPSSKSEYLKIAIISHFVGFARKPLVESSAVLYYYIFISGCNTSFDLTSIYGSTFE